MNHYLPEGDEGGCWGVIHREQAVCFTGKRRRECSSCNYISLMAVDGLTTVGDHLGSTLMPLADSKMRFSISVGAVEASALVSDIDLILQDLDDRRPS